MTCSTSRKRLSLAQTVTAALGLASGMPRATKGAPIDKCPPWRGPDLFEHARQSNFTEHLHAFHAGSKSMCLVNLRTSVADDYLNISNANHLAYARAHDYKFYGLVGRLSGDRFRNPAMTALDTGRAEGLYYQKLSAAAAISILGENRSSRDCEWITIIDGDAVFTNLLMSLETLLDNLEDSATGEKHVVLTRENTDYATSFLNTGVYIFRNDLLGRGFLEDSASYHHRHCAWGAGEQDAVMHYVFGQNTANIPMSERAAMEKAMRPEVALFDQRVMNSLRWRGDRNHEPHSSILSEWKPGDFVLHIASRDKSGRRRLINEGLKTIEVPLAELPNVISLRVQAQRNTLSDKLHARVVGRRPFCVVSLRMPEEHPYALISSRNHESYARLHGYSFFGFEGRLSGERFTDAHASISKDYNGGGLEFQRLSALAAAHVQADAQGKKLCEWSLWLDSDAVFTRPRQPLERIIAGVDAAHKKAKSIILPRELTAYHGSFVNAGVFMVKNDQHGWDFLEGSANYYGVHKDDPDAVQNAMQHWSFCRDPRHLTMQERGIVEAHARSEVALVDQRMLTAFTWKDDLGHRPVVTNQTEWDCDFIAHIASQDIAGKKALIQKTLLHAEESC